jgi:putative FmdB family regulatory protein
VPTYQYTCTECGDQVEAVQKFTDAPLSVCSACGGRLRKVFFPAGIVFKGSGFYRTDSRNGSGPSTATKEKEKSASDSGSASPAEGKAADKPAGKAKTDSAAAGKAAAGEKAA